ncbi:MAG: hypothetical protein HGN29_12240 [Asgard group archaeon]|nr:hypothetical protein [Asgard group archaeon]
MSSSISDYKDILYSIHILEQGVSIHSEKFDEFLNIDDILLFGFMSALHSYTYSVGQEEVKSIDFGTCKFIFEPLNKDKLLVIIAKKAIPFEEEIELVQSLKIRFEVISASGSIKRGSSLLDVKERMIPFELILEMRRKGEKEEASEKASKVDLSIPAIPEIKSEEFYFECLMNEKVLTENKIMYIKRTLSNFFLGYKKLILGFFVMGKEEQLTSFAYSRKEINEIFPLIQQILNDKTITEKELSEEMNFYKKIEFENQKIWVLTHASNKYAARVIFFSMSKAELESMAPHLSRIMYFVNKLI